MDIVTIDFETYYDKEYSLGKLTTEEYVRSPLFEVIGVSVKVNDHPADWYTGDNPGQFLHSLDYSDKAILAHNTAFDGAILSWHFGIKPKLWLDTLSMARPKHAVVAGGSLKKLARYYGIGEKGTEVVSALGKKRADFTPEEIRAYGDYCINDNDLTYQLWNILKKDFPVQELLVIDQTLRMYTEPQIVLDRELLEQHLQDEQDRKNKFYDMFGGPEAAKKYLNSNEKFAALLRKRGVEPPTKTSPRTGKTAYAFAKTDTAFTDLQEHDDPVVVKLVEARLGTKSTIEESRTQRLIEVSERGRLPILLNYYGAHTGRFSGGDKLNLQNLPVRKNNKIRRALCAPEGKSILVCDLSQIEARLVAYFAGQTDLVEAFREGRDVYSEFATDIYGYPVDKSKAVERFVGKTCLGAGTQVLTRRGWVPIVGVRQTDQLWDGVEWVNHVGVSFMGVKPTISLHGVELTPDHEILTGPTKWGPARYVLRNATVFQSALASVTLPSSVMKNMLPGQAERGGGDHYAGVLAAGETWAGSTTDGDTSRGTSGSRPEAKTRPTNDASLISKPVFDILNSGPRSRFTILTDAGPVIVHNCILGLGYGMGPPKFQYTLGSGIAGMKVQVDTNEATRVVYLYRNKYHRIQSLWHSADHALKDMMALGAGNIGPYLTYDHEGVHLPNGLTLNYHGLTERDGELCYINDARQWQKFKDRVSGADADDIAWTKIYGAKTVENLIQALARIVIVEHMVQIGKHYPVAFQVHDEIAAVVDDEQIDTAKQVVERIMTTAPKWAPDLPVACELSVAKRYGDAK